jgi:S-adenosylmethionine-dependent methyltransferase
VILNDLSSKNLTIAKTNAQTAGVVLEDVVHANALDITLHAAPASFDIVLCLGPLYHLTLLEERERVVSNALALAKPGAYVMLAYVTVFGHLRDVARRDPARLVSEWGFYEKYVRTGVYDRRSDNESFHVYPRDVERELKCVKGGAEVVKMVSCEGFLGFDTARALAGAGDEEMERWVDVVMQSADHPHTFSSAEHLVVVLKKF